MLPLLLLACTPAFDETRKDLDSFRLLGMAMANGAPRAAAWSGYGPWHETSPSIGWTVTRDDGIVTARAVITDAEGRTETGELEVAEDHVGPQITGGERTLDGLTASLSLVVPEEAEGAYTRWMASGGATIVEDAPNVATVTLPEAGWYTVFALVLDGQGGNAWTWVDLVADVDEPRFESGGRILPTDGSAVATDASQDAWLATLVAEDTFSGWRLTDLAPAEDADMGEVACGSQPFDLAALADGRCGHADADGKRVRIQGTPL